MLVNNLYIVILQVINRQAMLIESIWSQQSKYYYAASEFPNLVDKKECPFIVKHTLILHKLYTLLL